MRSFIPALTLAATAAAELIVMPPITDKGNDLAIVWIQGMDCDNAGYEPIAAEVQNQGYLKGQRIWVGIPEFPLDAPNGDLIDKKVNETLDELRSQGFTGDNVVLAGHSAGGAVAQSYATDHADLIKAQVLMGAAITRDHREINSDGTTKYNYNVPTLTLGGTKDGMMRISRIAEAFWHSDVNIEKSQKDLFPVMALEGVSHMQFSSGKPPIAVKRRDLKPDVPEATAHKMCAENMVSFFSQIIFNHSPELNIAQS